MTGNLRHEYSQLRRAAEQRARRLEQAGFTGYHAPKVRELETKDIKREYIRLQRWLEKDESTIKGARAAEQRRIEEAAARAERRREYQREYRRRKAEQAGRDYTPRPPITSEEERKARRRERNRKYRERVRERKAEIHDYIEGIRADHGNKAAQRLINLMSGLKKYGITIHSALELRLWNAYIYERQADSDKNFYAFDKWIDEMADMTGKGNGRIRADDVLNMLDDFWNWKADQAAAEADLAAPRAANEYSQKDLSFWKAFQTGRKKGR